MEKLKVMVVDNHKFYRKNLCNSIKEQSEFELTGDFNSSLEILNALQENVPSVILMSIKLPLLDGVKLTKRIKEQYKDVKIIAMLSLDEKEYVNEMLLAGAKGYIFKDEIGKDKLTEIIRNTALEKYVFSDNHIAFF